jgi:hypothetical protein
MEISYVNQKKITLFTQRVDETALNFGKMWYTAIVHEGVSAKVERMTVLV